MVEGGAALGMGFYRGVTGLVSKPIEGAKSKGIGGTRTRPPAIGTAAIYAQRVCLCNGAHQQLSMQRMYHNGWMTPLHRYSLCTNCCSAYRTSTAQAKS